MIKQKYTLKNKIIYDIQKILNIIIIFFIYKKYNY